MGIWTVYYPHSRDMDSNASDEYLDKLAADERDFDGAVAVNRFGEEQTLILRNRKWIGAPNGTMPPRAK